MLRSATILGLTISFFSLSAQDKPFEHHLGWRGSGSISVNSVADSLKSRTCVIARNSNTIKGFLFDSKMNFVKDFEAPSIEEEFLGGFIQNQETHVFLKKKHAPAINHIVYNTDDPAPNIYSIPFDLKNEKFLGTLNTASSFLYITAMKKDPVINVYKFSEDDQADKMSFDLSKDAAINNIEGRKLWTALSTASGWSRTVDLAVVDPDIECEADIADASNKIYLRGNKLLLLMDKDPSELLIFNFDLHTRQTSSRTIKRNYPEIMPDTFSKPKFNSFLLDNQLYFVHATSDLLSLSIYDFEKAKEFITYQAAENDAIQFKSTPILQEGGGTIYSQKIERELEKTKQLLRKMMAGRAVVSAVRNSKNQHEVTIGAYKRLTQSSGGMYMPGGAMGGAIASGFYVAPQYGASWNRVTRFKSLVDPLSARHLKGEISPSAGEQIQVYSKTLKIADDLSCVFLANNFHQFAYFDKGEKKLIITKF